MEKIRLQDYLLQKQIRDLKKPLYRKRCEICMHPEFSCYCSTIQTFDPKVQFVILIHPIEYQRRIATGRMAHLILLNSLLIRGHDFSENAKVNEIISNPNNHCLTLYPDNHSINLSKNSFESEKSKQNIFPDNKNLVVFVIDGTWATARQMMRQSKNLHRIQKICFTPRKKSNFRVRKQPDVECLSTIEAIHELIEVASNDIAFDKSTRVHDVLLRAFDLMVEKQIACAKKYA